MNYIGVLPSAYIPLKNGMYRYVIYLCVLYESSII